MTRILICLFICIVCCWGCETIVDFPKNPDSGPVPVIEALLTDQYETQQVSFKLSTRLNDSLSVIPVPDARIFVYTNLGDTFTYQYGNNGIYYSAPYKALEDRLYTLAIVTDTATYKSSASLKPMHGIDSLYIDYNPRHANDDSAYFLKIDAGEVHPGTINYYQIKLARNSQILTDDTNYFLFDDKYENSFRNFPINYAFKLNDTVTLSLLSLSKEMYEFYEKVNQLFIIDFSSIGLLSNPPQMFDRKAMGYFQVSAFSSKSIVIR